MRRRELLAAWTLGFTLVAAGSVKAQEATPTPLTMVTIDITLPDPGLQSEVEDLLGALGILLGHVRASRTEEFQAAYLNTVWELTAIGIRLFSAACSGNIDCGSGQRCAGGSCQ